MTSKPEGPGKDSSRPADAPSQKRPHATLDLKATEIKPDPAKGEARPAGAAEAGAAKPAEIKVAENKPAEPKPASGSPPPGAKPGEAAKPSTAPEQPASKTSAPPLKAATGGRGFSHFLASLAGGAIALAGAYGLERSGSLPRSSTSDDRAAAFDMRLATLEEATKSPAAGAELTGKIEEANARLAKLEGISSEIEKLAAEHSALAAEAKGLGEKLAQQSGDAGAGERLSKLEDRLATLAAAAGTDGDKSRVGNLAAITGRIGDLESRIDSQVAAVRKSIPEEIATRLGTVSEASEAARVTSQRIDREVQGVRSDVVRLGQRAEELKADGERLTQTLDVLKEEQGRHASELGALKGTLEREMKSVSRPADVSAAVAPVAERLANLESNIEGVVRNEKDRKVDAERIVVSLELANLKRAVDSGKGYAAELEAVRKAAGSRVDLSVLDRHQASGLPAVSKLEQEFREVANRIIDAEAAPSEGGVVDRLVAGALSVVRVRKIDPSPDDRSVEAVVARMEKALADGRLGEALEHAAGIPDKSAGLASEWRVKAEARHAVDKAIADIEAQLKSSLSGAAAPQPAASGSN